MPSRSRCGKGVASGVQGAVRRAWFQLGLHVAPEQVRQHLARRGWEVSLRLVVRVHCQLVRKRGKAPAEKRPAVRSPRRLRPPKRPGRRP